MGVMMQAFHWDCPKAEGKEFAWWLHVKSRVASLAQSGITSLWLPPASKAANIGGVSMGYDPYDYYDLGEFEQKGTRKTWFGSKQELVALIGAAHAAGMKVYADLVLNHCSGADAQEINPLDGQKRWTKFTPKSGKFARDHACFHPSPYEQWDDMVFEGMPDLCHRHPYVYTEMIAHARWLLEEVGFDGFRYDCVKGYGGWMVRAIQELRLLRGGKAEKPFGVGECWDSDRVIHDWLDETNAWSDNPASAFDFPLRWRLKEMCDSYGFKMSRLAEGGTLLRDRPAQAVTFVENHDIVRDSPIINDKMMAYAFILTHEGYPCVFWRDYHEWGLGAEGEPTGIAALAKLRDERAGGGSDILFANDDVYIMQRPGEGDKKGLVLVMNNRGDRWGSAWVKTRWGSSRFTPAAWGSRLDNAAPQEENSQWDGWVELWAPPRGYAVYLPK